MTDEMYLKMILALSDKFFDGWEWKEGDKFLCREPYYGEESIIHPIGYEWNVHTIGDHELRDNEIYKGDYELAYRKRKEKIRPLPSQEQLQKIILNYYFKNGLDIKGRENLYLLWRFQDWLRGQSFEDCSGLTIKELMLEFLMYVVYTKKWDGEQWL